MKPMLASPADLDKLRYPLLASPKFDGIRALVRKGEVITRSLKPLPNLHITKCLLQMAERSDLVFDGEVISGGFNSTQSVVMSHGARLDFTYNVFDIVAPLSPVSRYNALIDAENDFLIHLPFVKVVEQTPVRTRAELETYYKQCLDQGFEGICLRGYGTHYKYGRSTVREQALLKLKALEDCEAKIVGFQQFMHNGNAPEINELGYQERSSHAYGMVAMEALGAFIVTAVNGPFEGVTFNVGTGLTAQQRSQFWFTRETFRGKIITVTYQRFGSKSAPRQPVFKGFREAFDISNPEQPENDVL